MQKAEGTVLTAPRPKMKMPITLRWPPPPQGVGQKSLKPLERASPHRCTQGGYLHFKWRCLVSLPDSLSVVLVGLLADPGLFALELHVSLVVSSFLDVV